MERAKSFKKFAIMAGFLSIVIATVFLMAACGGAKPLYMSDFSKSDNGVFSTSYGAVTHNAAAKTVTLKGNADKQGANTYFGETDKNFDWVDGGMTVNAKFKIDSSKMDDGEGFNWGVAINGTDGNYLSERFVYVRKVGNDVKVGYTYNGSSDEINSIATSNADAKVLADGWYTFSFKVYANANNEIKADIAVVNSDNATKFEAKNANFNKTPDKTTVTKKDEIKGLRYGWLSWINVAEGIDCSEISVYPNK